MIIRNHQRFHIVLIASLLWWSVTAVAAFAQGTILHLDGPASVDEVSPHIRFLEDAKWRETVETLTGPDAPRFSQVGAEPVDFGYTRSRIWLRLPLLNTTDATTDWYLYFRENFKQIIDVYAIDPAGEVTTLLSLNRDSPFDARPIAYPEMVAPLTIAPGEGATVLIGLWSEGASYIEFSVETRESFSAVSNTRTARNFVFYGMMLLLITMALVSLIILRNPLFLAYSAYAASALLYIMHVDGVTFQYLWPDAPRFNSIASVFTGSGIISFGALYARMYLKTKTYHPVMDKVLASMIVINIALVGVLLPTNPQLLKKLLVFLSMIAIASFALTGVIAARERFKDVRFYLLAWLGAVLSAVMLNLNHIFGVQIPQLFLYDSIRAVMVFDAAMMGLAIADRYNQLRQSQKGALEVSLTHAQRNLELAQRLAGLEQRYQTVVNDARDREVMLQNTAHDLRQPLHGLRMSVQALIKEGHNPQSGARVNETFRYLEDLVSDYLQASVTEDFDQTTAAARDGQSDINLTDVLASIHEMFLPDARDKGLDFAFESEQIDSPTDPLAVMRIVSNLVANAIKYTDEGWVTLQGIAAPPRIVLSDTGPGLSAQEWEVAQTRAARLGAGPDTPPGYGLGLSIAFDLVRKHGLALTRHDGEGGGTRLVLDLAPKADVG